jgi:hypothetical protein
MNVPSSSGWDYEVRLLAWLAACVSVFSFLYYFRQGDMLLYGDAVAHINIARRVFDSKTPGLLQLGTVWLPLPHLLLLPFVISNNLWRSGAGGAIPSMAAYVFGVVGIFRLVRQVLSQPAESNSPARVAAWTAALIYGANPNLVYLQTTAMTEPLYLCLFIWAVLYFTEFALGDWSALTKCAFLLAAATLTRYDGWLLALVMLVAVIVIAFSRRKQDVPAGFSVSAPALRTALARFVIISAAGPVLWLSYNAAVYRNPLEFANGPYSPMAIEQKTRTVNPARGNLFAAGAYFLKSAELNVTESPIVGRLWLALSVLSCIAVLLLSPKAWPILLLWTPLLFYAMSVAYGSVPIFVPTWWPFSMYNLRYGLELLPALSAAVGISIYLVLKTTWRPKPIVAPLLIAGIAVTYAWCWKAEPICLREAVVNSRERIALEAQLAKWLRKLPQNSTLLMYLGEHPGAIQQAGIPLKRIINEGNHRVWKQPSDPEGLWERALAAPEQYADYVIATDRDSVWSASKGRGLKELLEIEVTGQRRAVVFRAR